MGAGQGIKPLPGAFFYAVISIMGKQIDPSTLPNAVVRKPIPGREPFTMEKVRQDVDNSELLRRQKIDDAQKANYRFGSLAEKLAQSTIFVKNYPVAAFAAAFPSSAVDHTAAMCFEHSPGGALYVDTATFPFDVGLCRKKAVIAKQAGLRYVWIEPDDTYDTALAKITAKGRA